jgi:hypothetical protein
VRGVLRREALLQSLMAGHCWLWAVVVAIKLPHEPLAAGAALLLAVLGGNCAIEAYLINRAARRAEHSPRKQ